MIHAFPETEIVNRVIIPYDEEAATFEHRMISGLESVDPSADLLVWFSMTLLQ